MPGGEQVVQSFPRVVQTGVAQLHFAWNRLVAWGENGSSAPDYTAEE
jgi:hypothetical protein